MGEDFFVRHIQIFAGILTDFWIAVSGFAAYGYRIPLAGTRKYGCAWRKKARSGSVNTVIEQVYLTLAFRMLLDPGNGP
jgi:hypothetical protein